MAISVKASMIEIGWTALFQIINFLIIIGIGLAIYNVLVKLPKRLRANEEKIKRIENTMEEILRKIEGNRGE
ncbi:MAG: hypothetical protein N4A57_15710 [Anaeromicrobium sp.]|uniref:hypothetical protein n=1 Tax=Anaeromicrobium sp. TaxID=1929132 RepID=UPI0025E9E48C|nr:hypothetical protein [Anaeromicrobium sp.]MCT4595694.1 hypothetical protein [Anaeromicrobium sp.]